MGRMFLLALLVIYLLLAIPLRSYVQPVLIMTAIPFGIVGAILGHWLNNLSLGILSLNGIIALSGVVVNDSLLLVARFNELRRAGGSLREVISLACRSRLRAVLLTSFTTFAGLMPLLGETSMQAQFLIPAVVSRRALEEAVWGDAILDSDPLKVHLFHLRKAIDARKSSCG
jgi:multidrug efflux pump subunit AcrB